MLSGASAEAACFLPAHAQAHAQAHAHAHAHAQAHAQGSDHWGLRVARLLARSVTAPENVPRLRKVANIRKQKLDGTLGVTGQTRDHCPSDRDSEGMPWATIAKEERPVRARCCWTQGSIWHH